MFTKISDDFRILPEDLEDIPPRLKFIMMNNILDLFQAKTHGLEVPCSYEFLGKNLEGIIASAQEDDAPYEEWFEELYEDEEAREDFKLEEALAMRMMMDEELAAEVFRAFSYSQLDDDLDDD